MYAVLSHTVLIGKRLVPRTGEMGRVKKSSIIRSKRERGDDHRNENLVSTKTGLNTVSYLNTIISLFPGKLLIKNNFGWHILLEKLAVIAHCNLQIHMVHCRVYMSL